MAITPSKKTQPTAQTDGISTSASGETAGHPAQRRGKPKVVVVMPAYNAAKTLRITYQDIPHQQVDGIILVDDGSTDETLAIARELNLTVFVHARNFGYGANQKTSYAEIPRLPL